MGFLIFFVYIQCTMSGYFHICIQHTLYPFPLLSPSMFSSPTFPLVPFVLYDSTSIFVSDVETQSMYLRGIEELCTREITWYLSETSFIRFKWSSPVACIFCKLCSFILLTYMILFCKRYCFILLTYMSLFTHSSAVEHLAWLHILALLHSGTINSDVQVFLWKTDPESWEPCGRSIFSYEEPPYLFPQTQILPITIAV